MKFKKLIPIFALANNTVRDTVFFGDSKYNIKLFLNSETEKKMIGESANTSKLNTLKIKSGLDFIPPNAGYGVANMNELPSSGNGTLSDFDGSLTFPIIDIEYVDLRCNFIAVSVIEHDIYHVFRQNYLKMNRDVFYSVGKILTIKEQQVDCSKNKTFNLNDRYMGNLYSDDESISDDELALIPEYLTHKKVKERFLDANNDCTITLYPIDRPQFYFQLFGVSKLTGNYQKTSCAYSMTTEQIVYHIKGGYKDDGKTQKDGYVGTFNGEKWVDFEPTNKTQFIDNHQIAFYFIDLGG